MKATGLLMSWQKRSLVLTVLFCFGVACFLTIPRFSKVSRTGPRDTANQGGAEVKRQSSSTATEDAKGDNKALAKGGYSRSDAFKRMRHVLQILGKTVDYGLVESEITYTESELDGPKWMFRKSGGLELSISADNGIVLYYCFGAFEEWTAARQERGPFVLPSIPPIDREKAEALAAHYSQLLHAAGSEAAFEPDDRAEALSNVPCWKVVLREVTDAQSAKLPDGIRLWINWESGELVEYSATRHSITCPVKVDADQAVRLAIEMASANHAARGRKISITGTQLRLVVSFDYGLEPRGEWEVRIVTDCCRDESHARVIVVSVDASSGEGAEATGPNKK